MNEVSWVHCTPASNSQLQNSAAAVGVASTVGGQVSDEEGVVWQHIGDNKRGHEGRGRQEVWPRKAREWPNLVLWPAQLSEPVLSAPRARHSLLFLTAALAIEGSSGEEQADMEEFSSFW